MTYARVIPRDLFNEANLLKCYGRLWILLDETRGHNARLGDKAGEHSGEPFKIVQDESDGSLSVANVPFTVAGEAWTLSRPLNTREPWPLYAESPTGDLFEVFCENGWFSVEFSRAIMGLHVDLSDWDKIRP